MNALLILKAKFSELYRKYPWILWLVVFAVGTFVLTYRIGHESIWADESFSAAIIQNSFADIPALCLGDSHPPLYYFMLKLWSLVFGNSVVALRLFSALGFLILALLGAGPVTRAFDRKTGLIFAFLVFTAPNVVSYAQEIRMYSWAAVFVTSAFLFGWLALREGKAKDWVLYGVFLALAMYIHVYGMFSALIMNLFFFPYLLTKERKRFLPYLLTIVAVLAAFAPWVPTLLRQVARHTQGFWITVPTGLTVLQVLRAPFDLKFGTNVFSTLYLVLFLILIGFGIARGYRKDRESGHLDRSLLSILSVGFYFAMLGFTLAVSLLVQPILLSRYFLILMGPIFMAAAYGLTNLPRMKYFWSLVGFIILFTVPAIVSIYQVRFNGPMREVVRYIENNARPGDVFIHTDELTAGPFGYLLPEYTHYVFLTPDITYYFNFGAYPDVVPFDRDELPALVEGHRRVWLISPINADPDTDIGRGHIRAHREIGVALGLLPSDEDAHGLETSDRYLRSVNAHTFGADQFSFAYTLDLADSAYTVRPEPGN